jgi:Bifunctional DNA primase/polymerase, N-terminal/Primase C terminal 1 (PriCT-1)
MTTGQPRCLSSALAFASRGLPVFPLHAVVKMDGRNQYVCGCGKLDCDSPGKHPLGRVAPNGFKDATTDKAKITHWFNCCPDANLGVATGHVVVVDVDPRNGGDESLQRLELHHGELPQTWRSLTGGGGEHAFFAPPAGSQIGGFDLARGIDLKAAGGYVVAPPSLHLSGRNYCWSVDHHPNTTPLAPLPTWITEHHRQKATVGRSDEEWRELIRSGVCEGERNNAVAAISGHLLRRYVDPFIVLDLLLLWNSRRCQPALPDTEVAEIVRSISGLELARRKAQNG